MEKVDASPTKEFFINMLTRDVPLDRAVLDLVDNSVDAAYAAGALGERKVSIEISKDNFFIQDNCGGIEKTIAKEYAFKFGRSKTDGRKTPHSVGQFGVGMKRTLFKMGSKFIVESNHPGGSFSINVNVDEWLQDAKHWEFELAPKGTEEPFGTKIQVTDLFDGVADYFSLDMFVSDIREDIEKAHFRAISKGLKITVNGVEAKKHDIQIKTSQYLQPVCIEKTFNGVRYKLVAGVAERSYGEGGWYIICNGRLVEYANTNSVTGWGQPGIRKYHPDYAFFRGVVEFEAEDSEKLPWTTTKTGVDADNVVYRQSLNDMKNAMKEVMSFLNKRRKEEEDFDNGLVEERPLNEALDEAPLVDIQNVTYNQSMITPDTAIRKPDPDPSVSVQYRVKKIRIDKLKEALGLETNKEVGKYTFDYVFSYEVDDE